MMHCCAGMRARGYFLRYPELAAIDEERTTPVMLE